ncbi:MAG: hypothetical protein NTY68_05235 [Candidatus Micrarchaeota archaeon]|nr:hypothetical protein [Candidatus Micrarchaeota archaeon]
MAEALAGIEAPKSNTTDTRLKEANTVAKQTSNTETLARIGQKSPHIADSLRQDQNNLNGEIINIYACLKGIEKNSGKSADTALKTLDNDLAKLFKNYPERFLKISEIAGPATPIFLDAMASNMIMRGFFIAKFSTVTDELEKFKKAAGGEEANKYIEKIMASNITETNEYKEDPVKFILNLKKILENAGESRNDVLDSLCDKNFAKFYAENQKTFVSLAKKLGGSTGSIFKSMKNDPATADKIVNDPEAFTKLFKEKGQDTTGTFTMLAGK